MTLSGTSVQAIVDGAAVHRNHLLLIFGCTLVAMADGFDVSAISFAAPVLAREMHLSAAMIGALLSISLVAAALGALAAGPLARRIGRRATLCLCLLWFAACSFGTVYADSYSHLLAARFATGLGLGIPIPLLLATIADGVPTSIRARAIGLMLGGLPVGGVLAGAISALWMPEYGWEAVFLIGAILPIPVIPVVLLLIDESLTGRIARGEPIDRIKAAAHRYGMTLEEAAMPADQAEARQIDIRFSYADMLRDGRARRTVGIMITMLLGAVLAYFLQNWVPALFDRMGLAFRQAAIGGTLLNLGTIAAVIIFGYLMDRYGVYRVAGAGFLASIPMILAMGSGAAPAILYTAVFLAGFLAIGSQLGASYLVATRYPPGLRIYATSVGYIFARAGSVLGPFMAGQFLEGGMSIAALFIAAAFISLAAAVGIWWLHSLDASDFAVGAQRA